MASHGLNVERTVVIRASPERVLAAFVSPEDLSQWWHVVRSVTIARPLGTYAVEWPTTSYGDELLGHLGGAFHGTVMEYRPGAELFVADAYWSPPEGDPVGPMAFEVRCAREGGPDSTRLTVRQSSEDEGPRWQRYFDVAAAGWQRALEELKEYLESEPLRNT